VCLLFQVRFVIISRHSVGSRPGRIATGVGIDSSLSALLAQRLNVSWTRPCRQRVLNRVRNSRGSV
jgi:hypothetical protein